MKPIDPRVERNTHSLLALKKLLEDIVQTPENYKSNETLLNGLKSQGGLAKLDLPDQGITPTSLNTIKRISEKSLEGGFDALDKLRRAALYALEHEQKKTKRSNKTTLTGLNQRVTELETENGTLQQELLLLTQLLEKSMREARHYAEASNNDHLKALCRKEQSELCAYLNLSHVAKTNNGKV